jgi:hypothetical protein
MKYIRKFYILCFGGVIYDIGAVVVQQQHKKLKWTTWALTQEEISVALPLWRPCCMPCSLCQTLWNPTPAHLDFLTNAQNIHEPPFLFYFQLSSNLFIYNIPNPTLIGMRPIWIHKNFFETIFMKPIYLNKWAGCFGVELFIKDFFFFYLLFKLFGLSICCRDCDSIDTLDLLFTCSYINGFSFHDHSFLFISLHNT